MLTKKYLSTARRSKNDEFYTRLEDIEKELQHYTQHLKDKIIYCPCDDYQRSAFVQFFKDNFYKLHIKRLIATCHPEGYKYEYDGVREEITLIDGDFRNEDCNKIMESVDIIITNPPFSLFREFIKQIFSYNKQFLILANTNAIIYKEIFPYIQHDKLWMGVSSFNDGMYFHVPDDYEYADTYKLKREIDGQRVIRVGSICWFTNMEHSKRNEPMQLKAHYTPEEYPKYDNYDAIEINKLKNIPMDYNGVMGVPITFLKGYCPKQFKIIDINPHFHSIVAQGLPKPKQLTLHSVNRKDPYARILIQKKEGD